MFPAVVVLEAEIDLHKWAPFGALGLSDEVHARFVGCAV